jgi:hypothetical protein
VESDLCRIFFDSQIGSYAKRKHVKTGVGRIYSKLVRLYKSGGFLSAVLQTKKKDQDDKLFFSYHFPAIKLIKMFSLKKNL